MTPAHELHGVALFHGDCLEVLRGLADASVDSVVTDPPYELWTGTGRGFMGKAWDGTGIAFSVDLWREVLRVLKPGGHLLAFGGTRTYHRMTCAIEDAGFSIRDSLHWVHGQGFPKSKNLPGGLGTALKPAHEPIVMARKPLIGTVAQNVAAHGTGALNIGACRIETSAADAEAMQRCNTPGSGRFKAGRAEAGAMGRSNASETLNTSQGRWPANFILSPEAAEALDAQSGAAGRTGAQVSRAKDAGFQCGGGGAVTHGHGDSGGASRFFYVAKPSKKERGEGNTHPTVKPVELMRYLVRLVTPPGGLVLDPFAGSGTTALACHAEGLRCLAIERDVSYLAIQKTRLGKAARTPRQLVAL